jgi:hypothetical protein
MPAADTKPFSLGPFWEHAKTQKVSWNNLPVYDAEAPRVCAGCEAKLARGEPAVCGCKPPYTTTA